MLHRIMGAAGSGKTEYMLSCLSQALKKGKQCYVIVPEQQSMDYEALLCTRLGSEINLNCEVLNFERLPNRIAREYGGLAINNIDKGGACALLSLIADNQRENLSEYAAVSGDTDFASSLFSLISRMKMGLITPEKLISSAQSPSLNDEPRLKAKLLDIGLIYGEYEKHFNADLHDPRDALTRLGEELDRKPFFKNTTVFIDGYYTFTEQEYKIISQIISQSDNTYVSFTVQDDDDFFAENRKCCQRVADIAHGKVNNYYTGENRRAQSKTLRFIQSNIWRATNDKVDNDGSVKLINANNRFDEVEAAAAEILAFVRAGNRFSDIALLAENTQVYQSIIDSVFSQSGIPCYMSSKEPISTKPLFSYLIASLSVITEDFSISSIKRYVKSGYSGLTDSESDALLNYIASWRIRGKAWYSDSDWTLDPEGYKEGEMSPRAARQLEIANRARQKLVEPLLALRETLKQKNLTVAAAVQGLYTHAISMGADELLRKNAEKILNLGDKEGSDREIQLWKLFINVVNQLYTICGEISVTPKRFLSLFRLLCDNYSLGAIPASKDSVTFGSATLLRAGGKKMLIVLGAVDGEFPSAVSTGGFFSRTEASVLEQVELSVADTMEKQLNTARFLVYAAFSAPTQRLVLLCPGAELTGSDLRPSSAWLLVCNMLNQPTCHSFNESGLLYSPQAIASSFPLLADCDIKQDIGKALTQNGIDYSTQFPLITDTSSEINYKDNSLRLSPTRFETYIKCPFSYFGQYVLGLKKKKINEFSMSEIGSFAHKLLDMFMRECVSTGKFIAPPQEQRISLIDKLAKEYLQKYIGAEAALDKQFMHIYSNMVKTLYFVTENLCAEFTESKFIPAGFEFSIGLGANPDIPAIQYDVNGKKVMLRGSIDRVDIYQKDGITYVRVIDYKTYSKEFSADLVACGMDTQLLHYLFAYCQKNNAQPAGALYYKVVLPYAQYSGNETEEELKAVLQKSLKRSGIMLDDPEIAFAMSPSLASDGSSCFVPVEYSKNKGCLSTRKKSKVLYTKEEFEQLSQQLKEQVTTLADNVFCGKMDIAPNNYDNKVDPCKYCPLGSFCRSKQEQEDEDFETDQGAE